MAKTNGGSGDGPPLYFCLKELEHFYNNGFGWICRRCAVNLHEAKAEHTMPRYFREGEADGARTGLATRGLGKWADSSRRTLVCPQCGTSESLDPA